MRTKLLYIPPVLPLLTNLMSPSSPSDVYDQTLRCFSSWVEFGIPLIEAEQLIIQVFQSLDNSQLFDTAVETLVKVFSHPDSHRYLAYNGFLRTF